MILNQLNKYNIIRNVLVIPKRFESASSTTNHYDIIVAGGGMVGTTLACTLAKNCKLSNKKILLLEAGKKSNWKLPEVYSNRVSSLNTAAIQLLNDIGAWKYISDFRYGTVKRMQVWDGISDATITFDQVDVDQPLACIVENDLLLSGVRQELEKLDSIEVVYEAKIQNCVAPEENKDEVIVCMDNNVKYSCDLLLGCDGANSVVGRAMGFHSVARNYNHMGVVATLKLPEDCENVVAWQRHLPDSQFLALLPLKTGLSSMVWSTNSTTAKNLLKLNEDEFVDAINEALCKTFTKSGLVDQACKTFDNLIRFFNLPSATMAQMPPKILGCDLSSRAIFPLGLKHSTNYVTKGVALVGDAAHRIHPLAGQGVNLGFGDVISLNRILGEAVYSGSKLGNLQYLKDYETERQKQNVPMMMAVHGLFHLYGTQFTPVVLLRSLGLQATNALTPLKKLLMAQASGVSSC